MKKALVPALLAFALLPGLPARAQSEAFVGLEVLPTLGHTGQIQCVAWSPAGDFLASASEDGTVRVWNAETGQEIHRLIPAEPDEKSPAMHCVAFSPSGLFLAAGDRAGHAHVWDVSSGSELTRILGHEAEVQALAWSTNGTWLITGSADNAAHVWDLDRSEYVRGMRHPQWGISVVAMSPSGNHLLTAGGDGIVRVWDPATGLNVRALWHSVDATPVFAAAWSPDGTRVASGDIRGVLRFWDPRTAEEVLSLTLTGGAIEDLSWSPQGNALAVASADGAVRVGPWPRRASIPGCTSGTPRTDSRSAWSRPAFIGAAWLSGRPLAVASPQVEQTIPCGCGSPVHRMDQHAPRF